MATPYANTKVKGDHAELEALAFLTRSGYQVSIPFGENCPYDLVAESATGVVYRVQVRWASWKEGVLPVRLRANSKNYCRTLNLDRIDVFLIYDGESFFLIPTDRLRHCKAVFSLKGERPKNGQKIGVSMAEDFKENLSLIP